MKYCKRAGQIAVTVRANGKFIRKTPKMINNSEI